VFAVVDDVAGKFSETEGELSAEVENGTDDSEQATEEKEDAAELAKGVHKLKFKRMRGGESKSARNY
jgi:hypothetical protein